MSECKRVSVASKAVKKELNQNCQLLKFKIVRRAVTKEVKYKVNIIGCVRLSKTRICLVKKVL